MDRYLLSNYVGTCVAREKSIPIDIKLLRFTTYIYLWVLNYSYLLPIFICLYAPAPPAPVFYKGIYSVVLLRHMSLISCTGASTGVSPMPNQDYVDNTVQVDIEPPTVYTYVYIINRIYSIYMLTL